MILDAKTQEIALLLIKASVSVRRGELRGRLEKVAFDLIEKSASSEDADIIQCLQKADALVRFGKTVYEIEPVNAEIIFDGLSKINSAIRQYDSASENQGNNIIPDNQAGRKNSDINKQDKPAINPAIENGNIYDNPAIRQSAILDKIRDFSGKSVQLKDIVGLFPSASERTLRYDLQRLSADGKIERIGQGGPATYYRMRVI